jgi:hypothetical protein
MNPIPVIPAKAGIQLLLQRLKKNRSWIPAFAGMTSERVNAED